MDRITLNRIFEKAYLHQDWLNVLQSIFGAKQLYAQPKSIMLPNNDRATEAFELGSFTTSDDRIIGLYQINVKQEVWLERNKVSLRELLRNVYKYDVDGAIVVFVQQDKWRLSFVSEIKVLNEEGEIVEQATEPKRYTYLLGKEEKIRTPVDRLSKLSGKILSLQDILNAFSVEALNEEFYKIVQAFFYDLIGGEIGQGKKTTAYGVGKLELPNTTKDNRKIYQEFAVRLIGRTVFSWFLKMKKSNDGVALLPEHLLSSKAVKNNSNYYHSILERLFFQTLNTPMEERVVNLPDGAEIIPFLNGGLFEPGIQDFYKINSNTGLSEHSSSLNISDDWFYKFFIELEKYNFTIDENSVTEIEVSVDPEMLGRIFENLLAEIDPDSGETARKSTGSFYTPREIVDYMATESLVQYIHNKTNIEPENIRPIFKTLEKDTLEFDEFEKEQILDALDKVKILDPACGSGAFPMGILQKIVQALQKLDSEANWWKKRQVDRIKNPTVRKLLKEKLASSGVEYARKIGVIQNSLYGVDIQPIAAEISKLRCFLSLVVDENIDESKPNRGIEPLPNLEFKFVTADTLVKLPEDNGQRSMFDNFEELRELEDLRGDYIQSYGKSKKVIKEVFLKVQQKIAQDQSSLFADQDSKAYKLGNWDPFGNTKSDWFDPKWMFGIEKFDVIIGNPPYITVALGKKQKIFNDKQISNYQKLYDKVYEYKANVYAFFISRSRELLTEKGNLSFIIPNTLLLNTTFSKLRKLLLEETDLLYLIDLRLKVFNAAEIGGNLIIGFKVPKTEKKSVKCLSIENLMFLNSEMNDIELAIFEKSEGYKFNFGLKDNIISQSFDEDIVLLGDIVKIYQGIITGDNKKFLAKEKVNDSYLPILRGRDIERFTYKFNDNFVLFDKEQLWSNTNEQMFFADEKLINRQTGDRLVAAYDNNKFLTLDSTHVQVIKDERFKIKYILALINSSLMNYWYKTNIGESGRTFAQVKTVYLKKIPIKSTSINVQNLLSLIVTYIITLNDSDLETPFNIHVNNAHISKVFEEVIDVLVMELYFKNHFEEAGIEFIKYAERDFTSIEGKTQTEQISIIHDAYQKLREKDNEIRNNLKLMDIRLADIVMPIKAGK